MNFNELGRVIIYDKLGRPQQIVKPTNVKCGYFSLDGTADITIEGYVDGSRDGLYSRVPRGTFKISDIKKVIFNDPATIVIWADDTKTVVKAQNDEPFDPEKGLAMAISKKAMGNKGSYCNAFKKWIPEEEIVKPRSKLSKVFHTMVTLPMLHRHETGYRCEMPSEPLILEPEDWTKSEWKTICKLFGFKSAERIKVSEYILESYNGVDVERKMK